MKGVKIMDKVLEILKEDSRVAAKDIATMINKSEDEVKSIIKDLEEKNIIVKYTTIINEEKVRLGQHCIYFMEELDHIEDQKGRKLSFIAQEIGREINTIGAKAQDSDIQQFVVMMKDELEKLKEQLANIL